MLGCREGKPNALEACVLSHVSHCHNPPWRPLLDVYRDEPHRGTARTSARHRDIEDNQQTNKAEYMVLTAGRHHSSRRHGYCQVITLQYPARHCPWHLLLLVGQAPILLATNTMVAINCTERLSTAAYPKLTTESGTNHLNRITFIARVVRIMASSVGK
jgi:hypothetical protein